MSVYNVKDTFEINVGGQAVKVEYDGVFYGIVLHFSFYGKNISSSGFRSYFLFVETYISLGYSDYKICARDIADSLYAEERKRLSKNGVIIEQLELFSL